MVTVLQDMLQEINLIQLFIEIVIGIGTTVLGFLLALKGEANREEKKDVQDAKQSIKDIIDELKKLNRINFISTNGARLYYIDPLKTPIWQGLISTNRLQLIAKLRQKKEQACEDTSWYSELLILYDLIEEFNNFVNLYTENSFQTMITSTEIDDENIDSVISKLSALQESLFDETNSETVTIIGVIKKLEKI